MKKTMILLLTFLLSLLPAAAMGNIADDFQLGHYSDEFTYTATVNTANYPDSYGLPTSDVSYTFTTTKTFDFDSYCSMASTYSQVKVYLLDEDGRLFSEFGWYEDLPPGNYRVIVEGKNTNGEINVWFGCTYPYPDYYYDTDIFSKPGSYDTEERVNEYMDIVGNELGDIILHFELEKDMRVHINQTGGTEQHTCFYLWNVEMQEIATSLSHPSDIPPISPGYAAMSINLEAGRYYVVCESLDDYTDDIERTVALLIECEDESLRTGDITHNYILTRTMMSYDGYRYIDKIDYYDGLGRPEQTVNHKASAHGRDLITLQEYDSFGRESNTWLPRVAAADNNGKYVPLSAFQTLSPELYNGDSKAYTKPVYEESPLKRIVEEYGVGERWHDNGKSRKYTRMTNMEGNDTLDCILFVVEDDIENDTVVTLKRRGRYATGTLSVIRTIDEDGNRTFEFTDNLGCKVLTRQIIATERFDTYHVMNLYGKPRAVLPPKASQTLVADTDTCWTSTHEILEKYAYLYRYHQARGTLCSAKKQPGCGWTIYKYDRSNRLIFTQDAVLRTRGKWKFTVPDVYGRTCLTGICENSGSSLQGLLGVFVMAEKDGNAVYGYGINGITLVDPVITSAYYYDNYSFRSLQHFENTALNYTAESSYDNCHYTDKAEGLLTGTLTTTIDGGAVTGYLTKVMYYDYRGRLVQSKGSNHMDGMEKEWLALDFTGNVTKRKHVHTANGKTTRTEVYTYTYDHVNRPLTTRYSLNGAAELTLVSNKYDELGRLKEVSHNNKSDLTTSYNYNVRSWITQTSNQRYSQNLTYAYGGNIHTQQWLQDGKTRKYTYTYDDLNRLTNAAYTGDGNYNTSYSYDKMGNITSLKRYDVSLVDNLTLTYNGNQLTKVEDAANNTFGFANGVNATQEYFYDGNGNLTKDSNKGIASISYNCLNLPSVVTFSNGNTITYLYAADGRKLRTVHVTNGATTTTDYCGNVIYENGTAKTLLTDAGYVDLADNSHHFYIKDHLGNNRIVADANGNVEESNQYYPFGLLYANASANLQPYKYNGKELDTKNSLNWYDYGARHYDGALGRWFVVDPLAEKYSSSSPFMYCNNNPLNMIDPDGKDGIYITYPDYKINVAGFKVPYLGHAGILLIDNKTGNTKYYEYGRYDKESIGIVRSLSIPNVEVDKQGKPTIESLNNVLNILSEKAGQNGSIEGAYIESDKFAEMNQYAKSKMEENSNSNRKKYSLMDNNCATFALDVLKQDSKVKDNAPDLWIQSPINIVDELQKEYTRFTFVKEENKR